MDGFFRVVVIVSPASSVPRAQDSLSGGCGIGPHVGSHLSKLRKKCARCRTLTCDPAGKSGALPMS